MRLTRSNRNSPYDAFLNGFHGFCNVFVTAAFAYTGTELTGLAAAETADPVKQIPKASTQVIWRIMIFYVVNLLLVGLIVPTNAPQYQDQGAVSRHSPFVIAIQLAGIKVLPSIFNAVILIAVISVANSCTFGSTRTIQALAANGMYCTFSLCATLTMSNRYGPQNSGICRQERSPTECGHPPTSLRLLGIHQLGSQRWDNFQLAPCIVRSFHSLRLWIYWSGSYSFPHGLVSQENPLNF